MWKSRLASVAARMTVPSVTEGTQHLRANDAVAVIVMHAQDAVTRKIERGSMGA